MCFHLADSTADLICIARDDKFCEIPLFTCLRSKNSGNEDVNNSLAFPLRLPNNVRY